MFSVILILAPSTFVFEEKSLFDDKDAVQLRCTERSIIFTVLGIASLVCHQVFLALNAKPITNFMTFDFTVPQII